MPLPQSDLEVIAKWAHLAKRFDILEDIKSDPFMREPGHVIKYAATNGIIYVVNSLIESSDKSARRYALYLSALNGHKDIVNLLLTRVFFTVDEINIALQFAALNGHTEIVERLIPISDPKTNNSKALQNAAKNGHLECVRLLIPVSDPKADESEALRRAVFHGHLEVVRELLPVSDVTAKDFYSIRWAMVKNDLPMVKLIAPYCEQESIILAAECGYRGVVDFLCSFVDRRSMAEALKAAIIHDRLNIVRLLIKRGKGIADINGLSFCPLTLATKEGHLDIVKILVNSKRVDLEKRLVPTIFIAADYKHFHILEFLAPYCRVYDTESKAFIKLARYGYVKALKILLPYSNPLANNSEALICAARNGHFKTVEFLID